MTKYLAKGNLREREEELILWDSLKEHQPWKQGAAWKKAFLKLFKWREQINESRPRAGGGRKDVHQKRSYSSDWLCNLGQHYYHSCPNFLSFTSSPNMY